VSGQRDGTPRVVTFGETMALFVSETPGALAHTDELKLRLGGAESNVAIALRRLGTEVTWLGRVGNDSLGELVTRELRAEGIDARAIVDSGAPTGLMIRERRTADRATVWYYRAGSAGSRIEPADLDDARVASAGLLHVTGITAALSDSGLATMRHAVAVAKAAGVPVSFDVNHRASLWKDRDFGSVYRELAATADIVFAGEDEARLVVPDAGGPDELARAIAELGPSQVVIKLGADGCYALVDGVAYEEAAVPVRVVDTVGAGDAFVAGYLAEFLAGLGVAERLRTAVTVGAFACLSASDWEGLPRRSELGLLSAAEPVTR
jgi:2-dehydro-3-deoxygluconokinase